MPGFHRHCLWRRLTFAGLLSASICPGAPAGEPAALVKDADQYFAGGNLKAAEIELKNAVRQSPQDPIIRARLAEIYLQLGDAAAAESEARAARERGGGEADYLPILADALLRQDKFAEVLNSIHPSDRNAALESKVRAALGTAAAGLRDQDKAAALLRDAVRLDPRAVKPKIQLAQLLNANDPAEADKLIDEVIAADPRSTDALQVKGEMLRVRGDLDGALRLLDQALQIDPKSLPAILGRAEVDIIRGEFKAAGDILGPILAAAPDNFMANYLRALGLANEQQFATADRILDHISPGFARFPPGYYLQGAAKFSLGQFKEAEIALGKYLSQGSDDPEAVRLMARAALQQRAAPRAIEYLKLLTDRLPADTATLTLLGNAYMADHKPELALQEFQEAAAMDPKDPAMRTRVAISQIDTGQHKQGLAQLEQVFARDPGAAIAGPTLVLADLGAGRVGKAAEVARSLVERDANNPLYLTLLGEVRAAQQDYVGAEAGFHSATARAPNFTPATRDLAQLYLATGRADDAKKVYIGLLSKKPNDASNSPSVKASDVIALLGLADVATAEKKWVEAIDYLGRARAIARSDPAPGIKLIKLYELRADWESAKAVAAELAQQFPRDPQVADAHGHACLEAGDRRGAIASFKRAQMLAPSSVPILARYVSLLRQAGYFRDARDVLQDAIARNPQDASIKADLIRVEAELDGLDTALYEARGFAKDDPGNTLYDLVSAEIYENAGRAGDAAALLEKALAVRPSDDLTIALARLRVRMGDPAKAEVLLSNRLQTDPKNLAAASALAPLYLMTGRPDDARRIYDQVLAQRPNDLAALLGLADIAVGEMKWEEATDYIKRARAITPNDPAPGLKLVNLYAARQDWQNALATATELAEKFLANFDVIDAKARIELGVGDTVGAVSTYRRAYERTPDSVPVFSRYLAALSAAKKFDQKRLVLKVALDRNPQDASLKGDLIRTEAEIGGLDAGLEAARSFARNDPDNSTYDVVSAELYQKAGRSGEGVGLLEKAVAAQPSDDNLTIALSDLYRRTGEPEKAETVLQTRLKTDPSNYAVRSALASVYSKQQKYGAAITEYSRLIAERPADPAALNNLAWLYQRQGALVRARQLAARAAAISPGTASIIDTLGWILLNQGEPGRALPYLTSATLSDPRSPDLQYHLAAALHRLGRPAEARARIEPLLRSGLSFADKDEAEKLLEELKHG